LDNNIKNYKYLENYPDMKITIPSQYFNKLFTQFSEKVNTFRKEMTELESLLDLQYNEPSDENDNENNYALIEKFIQEIYNALKLLISEAMEINQRAKTVKIAFLQYMKINYNIKEEDINIRYKSFLERNSPII